MLVKREEKRREIWKEVRAAKVWFTFPNYAKWSAPSALDRNLVLE